MKRYSGAMTVSDSIVRLTSLGCHATVARLVPVGRMAPLTVIALHSGFCYLAVAEMTRSNLHTFDKQQQEAFAAIRAAW